MKSAEAAVAETICDLVGSGFHRHGANCHSCNKILDAITPFARAARAEVWEEAAKIADHVARLYGEKDESETAWPTDVTCGAVACAVNIASELRARLSEPPRGPGQGEEKTCDTSG